MRNFTAVIVLSAVILAASPLHATETSSAFAKLQGDYLERGRVKISSKGDATLTGTAKLRFQTASTGKRAKLKIHATIALPGKDPVFSSTLTLKHSHRAVISNLAPGIDDGHLAHGKYHISGSRITAEFPFTIGTTTGKSTLLVRLRQRGEKTQIIVEQTLFTPTLKHPIAWTFSALSGH